MTLHSAPTGFSDFLLRMELTPKDTYIGLLIKDLISSVLFDLLRTYTFYPISSMHWAALEIIFRVIEFSNSLLLSCCI